MTTPSADDLTAFRNFEQSGWNSTADKYDQWFGGLTPYFCEHLLNRAQVTEGVRVLDIACGPGYLAGAAAGRGAEATGVDFAPNMLAEARRLHPLATFREGDAENLPFAGESFDSVAISFGMLHFARPEAVLAEARRVLRPGGHLSFTVWGNPQHGAVGCGILLKAIETHGKLDVGLPPGPPMFRFSNHDESRRVLLEAGFEGPQVEDLPYLWRLPNLDGLVAAFTEAGVRAGEILRLQTPEALPAIIGQVRDDLGGFEMAGVFRVPMGAVLASATKPIN
jgi:ubiquinone/menaquinone biosynthesis C-methylase UbiE